MKEKMMDILGPLGYHKGKSYNQAEIDRVFDISNWYVPECPKRQLYDTKNILKSCIIYSTIFHCIPLNLFPYPLCNNGYVPVCPICL